jgi:hypothetical protein
MILPVEICEVIVDFCDVETLRLLLQVSRFFSNLVKNSNTWSNYDPFEHANKKSLKHFSEIFKINFDSIASENLTEYQKYHVKLLLKSIKYITTEQMMKKPIRCSFLFELMKKINKKFISVNIKEFIDNLNYNKNFGIYKLATDENILKNGFINLDYTKNTFGTHNFDYRIVAEMSNSKIIEVTLALSSNNKILLKVNSLNDMIKNTIIKYHDTRKHVFIIMLIWTSLFEKVTQ